MRGLTFTLALLAVFNCAGCRKAEEASSRDRTQHSKSGDLNAGENDPYEEHLVGAHVPRTSLDVIFDYRPESCGSGGCTLLVIDRSNPATKLAGDVRLVTPPITYYPDNTKFPDIGALVAGGGVSKPYRVRLSRKGGKYPFSTSTAGSRKTTEEGVVLIGRVS